MNMNDHSGISQKTLQLIGPVMLVYLLILALIDGVFYPAPTLTPLFYLIMTGNTLLIMLLTYLPVMRQLFGKVLLPMIIGLLVIVPIVASFLSIPMFHPQT